MTSMAVAIALCLTDGLGSVRLNRILRQLESRGSEMSSLADYSTRNLADQLGFSLPQAQTFAAFAQCGRHLASLLEDRGGHVVSALEPGFPLRLHDRYATRGPALLFVRGDARLLSAPAVAIGGSRNASDLALRATIDAVRIAVAEDKIIVSGGARGVDIVAHQAALDAGGRTVVILPQGLLTYSPPPSIAAGLDDGRVTLVSEFPPDLPWSTYAAMQRNRTVVGLGEAFVVAEAGTSGGTKAAADGALAAKVPIGVFAFPEPSMPEGNRALIARGGVPIPVTGDGSVDRDALIALPVSTAGPSGPIQSSLF